MSNGGTFVLALTATVCAWGAWGYTILKTDPVSSGVVGYVLFYATFFLAVSGSAVLLGAVIRRHATPRAHALRIAIRQGVLVGLGVIVAVFLQSHHLLSGINFSFLVLALSLLEFFIISLHQRSASVRQDDGSRPSYGVAPPA